MTAASDGVLRSASDKTQRYEGLRSRVLEERRAPIIVVSAAVLVRQGMSAWMQLDGQQNIEPPTRSGSAQHRNSLPGAKHSELLAVLTSLVFNVCKQKESA
jgi:hypothetical protein